MPQGASSKVRSVPKPVPEATSAEALGRYVPGVLQRESQGPAWQSVRARLVEQTRDETDFAVPAVAEAFLVRVCSGTASVDERLPGGSWVSTLAKPGALYLTAPGAGFEMRVRLAAPAPLVTFQVLLGLPLLAKASEEVFGNSAVARLRHASAFDDAFVSLSLEKLEAELTGSRAPSALLVAGLGQALAVHLVRHYTVDTDPALKVGGLAGSTLRRVTDRMGSEVGEASSLRRWAALAGMSPWHFSRVFKQSTGLSPMQYFLNLRMAAARRLLRETRRSVLQIGMEVGYSSPSHFAQVFRRETGLSPVEYRRQM